MKAAEKLRWYVHRMRAMSPAEVGHRFAEKYRHATQGRYVRRISATKWDSRRADFPVLPERADAPVDVRVQLKADAEALQKGAWQLFGWRQVQVGVPPAWHRDPVGGVEVDAAVPSHRLNHRQLPEGVDARRLWEINRWTEMTRLAMHGWLNDDAGAIQQAQQWLGHWCDHNPPGHGINWTSPLEAAIRLINFCWFDALARTAAPAMTEAQDELVERIVPVHAGWIWRHRSFGSSANNHLLGELAALAAALRRWPGLSKMTCDAELACQQVETEVLKQFASDGGSKEQALHYHLFAWELAWHALDGKSHERLKRAADFFRDLAPEGEPWDFGDSDDAQVLPVTLDRPKAVAEWNAWLHGRPGALRFWLGEPPHDTRDLLRPPFSWKVYPETGMAVNKSAWNVRLDASPLGFGPLAAHGHCDALHVSVWDEGEAVIVDPGTGGYFGAPKLRGKLAAWDAHNGPQPTGGFRSPRRIGVFLQTGHHGMPVLAGSRNTATAMFRHEDHSFRRDVHVRAEAVEIHDLEEGGKPFRVLWQLAPGCAVTSFETKGLTSWQITKGTRRWVLRVAGETSTATWADKTVSPAYGWVERAPALSVEARGPICMSLERQR